VNEARPKTAGGGGPRSGSGGGAAVAAGTISNEDYREATRQPREPRW